VYINRAKYKCTYKRKRIETNKRKHNAKSTTRKNNPLPHAFLAAELAIRAPGKINEV
jgi:hypothetical protein